MKEFSSKNCLMCSTRFIIGAIMEYSQICICYVPSPSEAWNLYRPTNVYVLFPLLLSLEFKGHKTQLYYLSLVLQHNSKESNEKN